MLECFSLSASRLYGFLELAMVWDSRSSASLRPKAMHTPLAEQLHVALEVAGAFNVPHVPARGKPWGRRRAEELVSFSPQRLTNRNQLFTSKTDFLNRQFDPGPGLELVSAWSRTVADRQRGTCAITGEHGCWCSPLFLPAAVNHSKCLVQTLRLPCSLRADF